jgi:hypothetical protein
LNLVTGKSQKRNPFYCKKFVRMEAETDCVVFQIPHKILKVFGTLRQSFVKRKSPWSAINIKATLEQCY